MKEKPWYQSKTMIAGAVGILYSIMLIAVRGTPDPESTQIAVMSLGMIGLRDALDGKVTAK